MRSTTGRGTFARATALVLAATFTFAVTPAPSRAPASARLDALVALCRLWNAVRFTHPALVDETDARWDDALLAAVPALERDPRTLQAVATAMLATLHDPYSAITTSDPPAQAAGTQIQTRDQVHVVTLGVPAPGDTNFANGFAQALRPGPADRGLVVDLRLPDHYSDAQGSIISDTLSAVNLVANVSTTEVAQPALARRYFEGFPPEDRAALGAQYLEGRETFAPPKPIPPAKTARDRRVAFVVDAGSYLPPGAAGLVRAGKAAVVSRDGQTFWGPGDSIALDAGNGLEAEVRIAAPAEPLPTLTGDIPEAIAWVREEPLPAASPAPAPQVALATRYAPDALPDEPHRILAVFRIWGTIEYAYPYRDLMHDDWDAALRDALGALPQATTQLAYARTVLRMYAHLHDTHGFVGSHVLQAAYGAAPRFQADEVAGRPTIVDVDPRLTRTTGLRRGDVVEAVDGVDVPRLVRQLRPYINASTEQSLHRLLDGVLDRPGLFSGPLGSTLTLRVRGARGVRSIRVAREAYDEQLGKPARPIVEVLPSNIGYVDLTRLQPAAAEAALARVARTRALVLDMRGYPHDSIYPLAPHLTAHEVVVANFRVPVRNLPVGARRGPFEELVGSREFREIVQPKTPHYAKPVIVLIDVRAVSAAEHTSLYLEAAAHARFVGQPTTGANGGVTTMIVPGNLHLHFSGEAITHADGRRLQRVGIIPDVPVALTLAGVRAGRDEIFEAGVREALRLSSAHHRAELNAASTSAMRPSR